MAKKKTGQLSISEEAQSQAMEAFERYHQVVSRLHAITERKDAEEALAELAGMPEAAQLALLKTLARERSSDAADLLLAINELSPLKEVRKEAKRGLIQLAGAKIYPRWKPPVEQPPASLALLTDAPRRFWKGTVTDSREEVGEAQLMLAWEQGGGNNEVLVMGFLLEYFHDGVKDFFQHVMSKRSFENTASRMESLAMGVKIRDISLAEGRHFILDALEVNKLARTQPHFDYRKNLSLIKTLILEAPDLDDDYETKSEPLFETRDLSPEGVVSTFVESYFSGQFAVSYELLAANGPLKDNLTPEAWTESRDAWFREAHPDDLQPNLLWERPEQKSGLWLPALVSASRKKGEKVIEAGWAIELQDTTRGDSFPELPVATAVYNETNRHWFWASYVLVKEEGQWRIQFMNDEGTEALNLPTAQLQERVREHDEAINEITHKHKPTAANAPKYAGELLRHVLQGGSYIDALLARSYDDYALYKEAAEAMQLFGYIERSLVYMEQITQRFEENRAGNLRVMSVLQRALSQRFDTAGDAKRAERLLQLAERGLRDSLAIEDRLDTRISLAEVLIERETHLDEAKDHLLQAKSMIASPDTGDEAHIEMHLGEIAILQKRNDEALRHYLRVTELAPDVADSWADLGAVYKLRGNVAEAVASYRRAQGLQPENTDLLWNLGEIYLDRGEYQSAIQVFEEALENDPDSAELNTFVASAYLEAGDTQQAEIFINKAEELDPEHLAVPSLRSMLEMYKSQTAPVVQRPSKFKKKRR